MRHVPEQCCEGQVYRVAAACTDVGFTDGTLGCAADCLSYDFSACNGPGVVCGNDAIEAFDLERGVKFETYCAPRIRGAILDELRSMDWVPRLVRARAHQLSKATHSLEIHLGRKPTEKEIAKELDMDADDFNRLQRDANAVSLVSLDTKYGDGEGEKDIREIDIIKDERSKNPVIEA